VAELLKASEVPKLLTTSTAREFRIPEYNLSKLQERIGKLNESALKLGCSPILLKVVGTEEIKDPDTFIISRYYKVTVQGEAPKLKGWSFVATLTHAPEGNIIRTAPNETIPQSYYTAKPVCDYCKKDWILRRDTYIIKDEKGNYRQIGSNCLSDFLGHPDPQRYASFAEALAYLPKEIEQFEGSEGGMGPTFSRMSTEDYLAYVAATIDKFGWTSRKDVYEHKAPIATADEAYEQITSRTLKPSERVTIEPKHRKEAKAAIAYISANVVPDNEYLHNLKTFAGNPAFTIKEGMGTVASILPFFRREQEKLVKKQQQAVIGQGSNFVGEIGERLYDIPVTVLSAFTPEASGP
jgi:hypothetical protein